jgi:hypothetical protein
MEAERNDGGAEAHGVPIKTMGGCTGATALRDCELSFLSRLVGVMVGDERAMTDPTVAVAGAEFPRQQILSSCTSTSR